MVHCHGPAWTMAAVGSTVSLPTTLPTRQKTFRKQTESLQRRERKKCARFRPEQAQQTQLNSSKFGKQASTGCASPERAASSAATINPRRAEPRKLSLIIGQYCLQVVRSSRSLH